MRPDKKKTRHHDSLKCEAKAKQKAAEKAKKEQKAAEVVNKKVKSKAIEVEPSHEVGSLAVASASSLAGTPTTSSTSSHHQESEAYSHRKVTSNWTKYEIPSSSDDNDESGTGPDYNFVLENSAKAADHLQLKAEKDWEIRHQEYHQDLFALNMTDLEAKLDAIPLYDIIDFRIEDLDVSWFTDRIFNNFNDVPLTSSGRN